MGFATTISKQTGIIHAKSMWMSSVKTTTSTELTAKDKKI